MSDELKPCPFCGGGARYVKHSAGIKGTQGFDYWDAAACEACGGTVGACDRRFRQKDDAARAWNRRVSPPADESVQMDARAELLLQAKTALERSLPHRDPTENKIAFECRCQEHEEAIDALDAAILAAMAKGD